jgi:hypothetical protein
VLVGWLLLVAPRNSAIFHPERPISKWDHVASFSSREACEKARDQMIVYLDSHRHAFEPDAESPPTGKLIRCFSSEDPALAR